MKRYVIIIMFGLHIGLYSAQQEPKSIQVETKRKFANMISPAETESGSTPNGRLLKAVFNGKCAEVSAALKEGAHPDSRYEPKITGRGGHTALMLAALYSSVPLVKILTLHKADVNAVSFEGETPLMSACRNQASDVTELLLQQKANIDKADDTGLRALSYATASNSVKNVITLLNHKADVFFKHKDDSTWLKIAFNADFHDIFDILTTASLKKAFQLGRYDFVDELTTAKHKEAVKIIFRAAHVKLAEDEAIELDKVVTPEQQKKLAKQLGNVPWVKIPTFPGCREIVASYLIDKDDTGIYDLLESYKKEVQLGWRSRLDYNS